MKYIAFCLAATFLLNISMPSSLAFAQPFVLPNSLEKSFEKACATQDSFVIDAVRNKALNNYQDFHRGIQDFFASRCQSQPTVVQKKEQPTKSVASTLKKERDWQAWVDAGFALSTGNTQERQGNVSVKLEHEIENWKNTAKLTAKNQKEKETRIAEEYRVLTSSRYKWREKHYFFGDVDYINDRYSGYAYRVSETAGYGHVFLKSDDFLLEAEGSIGGRQSKLADETTEASMLQKFTARLKKDFTKDISFSEELTVSFGEDATITESDAILKSRLVGQLYLKLNLNIEHISDVPVGTKNTDTLTTLNLGYHF